MPDILDSLSEEEIAEYVNGEKRRAEHEALARKANPLLYDKLDNYCYWLDALTRDRNGNIEKSVTNLCRILENDFALNGICWNQLTESFEARRPLPWREKPGPWRDADDAQLIRYVDERYCGFPVNFYATAMNAISDEYAFHPIREYFRELPDWDGRERVDRLLIDYLGAPDSPYVRAVTRKTLCAAVRRAFQPGCKFDNILVLSGPQGIGKSTLIARLGMGWFTDSLTVSDMNDKTAAEKLQGNWIVELSEMAGMKKAELEKVKSFLSRQDDKYRASYGHRVSSHPRQCVFFGTTNEEGYLRDVTGNRRFWTVPVTGAGRYKPWELDEATTAQIWREAAGLTYDEPLWLPRELEPEAERAQREALERDDREGLVRDYLDKPIPTDWEGRSLGERLSWYQTPTNALRENRLPLVPRTRVSNMEIWCECFGRLRQELTRRDSAAISAIMARIEGWEKTGYSEIRGPYGPQRIYRRRTREEAHTNIQHTMA